ncbi:hypothetical protein MSWAN_1092 [Methanobacterium paludis]|jgi:hypothetical protein|uniref:Uncharacterized protein n=1 Tax=Methanobacterium paludis (strain DSM 25820 / JCM 18151 / SWAN1) TaxID=868131 RepID=F6D4B4_METPW|nr:hypothetical protein MSWAN_1092 [Methanobacterium paludis]
MVETTQATGGSMVGIAIIFLIIFLLFPAFAIWLLWIALLVLIIGGIINILSS